MILGDDTIDDDPIAEFRELQLLADDFSPVIPPVMPESSGAVAAADSAVAKEPVTNPVTHETKATNFSVVQQPLRKTDIFRATKNGKQVPVCYVCHREGHIARHCRRSNLSWTQPVRRHPNYSIKSCNRCGEPTKVSNVCRYCCTCH